MLRPKQQSMENLLEALTLSAGYNAALVCIGAAILGGVSGAIGVFVLLRKRSLVSDAASHATLPGVVLGYMAGVVFFNDGRILSLLLAGAAITAAIGILAVDWIRHNTRLTEDTAIGTILSTFFALGMVLMSIVQSMGTGGQAGLEGFLLGAAAGMLQSEALLIAGAAVFVGLGVLVLMKEFILVSFDEKYAGTQGFNAKRVDFLMLMLLLSVIVIGLKTVGLVLIIALVIIPPVAARFWTERVTHMIAISAAVGSVGCYVGAAVSATFPNLPTGGLIVTTLFGIFLLSMFGSPIRGVATAYFRHRRFQHLIHQRQGLLAIASDQPIFDTLTLKILKRSGFIRGDGTPTREGYAAARKTERDQALWNCFRTDHPDEALILEDWSVKPIEKVLPSDMIDELCKRHNLSRGI